METRNIALTLEKAREWYNCGGADLREIALQAYTKDELEIPEWQNIKTFKDACRALGIYDRSVSLHLGGSTDTAYYHHMDAVSKLDIIRKALNGDWKPSLVQGSVYYPYVRFYPAGQKAREAVSEHKEWKLGESFIADGKKYTLVGGGCYYCAYALGKQEKDAERSKEKLMCLRDRTKVCNRCHACDIDTDAWHSMYSR